MKTIIILFALLLASCQNQQDESVTTKDTIFILCEGNFGSSNASLWSLDDQFSETTGPIHWDPNTDPLGDVGQSLTIADNRLYIVVNNSHTIEVMNISSAGAVYDRTIDVAGASPRYLKISDGKAYVSCWGLKGILVIDLANDTFVDTIAVNGLPEDLVVDQQTLYAGIIMDPFWASTNKVFQIDIATQPVIVDSFIVGPGPERLLLHNGSLYVTSTYYDDNWQANHSTSRIDLSTGEVFIADHGTAGGFQSDLVLYQDEIYRIYAGGAVPLSETLTPDTTRKIGNFDHLYSLGVLNQYLIFGTTDYTAPDEIIVVNRDNETVAELSVGALPGDFASYSE